MWDVLNESIRTSRHDDDTRWPRSATPTVQSVLAECPANLGGHGLPRQLLFG